MLYDIEKGLYFHIPRLVLTVSILILSLGDNSPLEDLDMFSC